MKRIQLFIFDLDGTLIDSEADIATSVNAARRHLGFEPLPSDTITSFVGRGVNTLMSKALGTENPELLKKSVDFFWDHYRDHCVDETRLYPHAQTILDHFRNKKIAIVTNKPKEFTDKILKVLDISSYFSIVLSGDSLAKKKPDPYPLLHAMEKTSVGPDACLMVGDSNVDIQAGKNAGVLTCGVTYGFGGTSEMKAAQPHYLVQSLEELRDHFD